MTEGLNVTHIYDVFLGVCVRDNGYSGMRWYSMLKGGLKFQANHFFLPSPLEVSASLTFTMMTHF